MERVHTRYGNAKEQQALDSKYRGLVTETVCYREIDERQNVEDY
jgi:hypothetical protein